MNTNKHKTKIELKIQRKKKKKEKEQTWFRRRRRKICITFEIELRFEMRIGRKSSAAAIAGELAERGGRIGEKVANIKTIDVEGIPFN